MLLRIGVIRIGLAFFPTCEETVSFSFYFRVSWKSPTSTDFDLFLSCQFTRFFRYFGMPWNHNFILVWTERPVIFSDRFFDVMWLQLPHVFNFSHNSPSSSCQSVTSFFCQLCKNNLPVFPSQLKSSETSTCTLDAFS